MKSTRLAAVLLLLLAQCPPASAFEAVQGFTSGRVLVSIEGGYGDQVDLDGLGDSDLKFFNVGARLGFLPFGPTGPGLLRGALELGLQPMYQRFVDPEDRFFAGLAAVGRYHFLTSGRFVPYVEVAGAAGGTDLDVREQDSEFTFLLFGGAGASYFFADRAAIYAGYRFQHISNAGTASPNRGINSHTAVLGLTFVLD